MLWKWSWYTSASMFFFFFLTFLCFFQTKVSWYISNDYFSVFQGGECQCQAGRGCSNAEDGPVFCPRPGLPHRWVPGHPLRHVRPAADLWWSGGKNEKILPSVRRQIVSEVLFCGFADGLLLIHMNRHTKLSLLMISHTLLLEMS